MRFLTLPSVAFALAAAAPVTAFQPSPLFPRSCPSSSRLQAHKGADEGPQTFRPSGKVAGSALSIALLLSSMGSPALAANNAGPVPDSLQQEYQQTNIPRPSGSDVAPSQPKTDTTPKLEPKGQPQKITENILKESRRDVKRTYDNLKDGANQADRSGKKTVGDASSKAEDAVKGVASNVQSGSFFQPSTENSLNGRGGKEVGGNANVGGQKLKGSFFQNNDAGTLTAQASNDVAAKARDGANAVKDNLPSGNDLANKAREGANAVQNNLPSGGNDLKNQALNADRQAKSQANKAGQAIQNNIPQGNELKNQALNADRQAKSQANKAGQAIQNNVPQVNDLKKQAENADRQAKQSANRAGQAVKDRLPNDDKSLQARADEATGTVKTAAEGFKEKVFGKDNPADAAKNKAQDALKDAQRGADKVKQGWGGFGR